MRLKRSEILAVAITAVFVSIIIGFGVYPSLSQASRTHCANNLKRLGRALQLYSGSHGDRFPPPGSWADALWPTYGVELSHYQCPQAKATAEQLQRDGDTFEHAIPVSYSLFRPLAGRMTAEFADRTLTPLFFDSSRFQANSEADLTALAFRHVGKTANIWFADGHCEPVTAAPALPSPFFKAPDQVEPDTTETDHSDHGH